MVTQVSDDGAPGNVQMAIVRGLSKMRIVLHDWESAQLPPALLEFMKKWQHIADEELKVYEFEWPAKWVTTRFSFNDQHYALDSGTFGVPEDLMERLQYGIDIKEKYGTCIDDDLERIGCSNISSIGFLD